MDYVPPCGRLEDWGDNYANRSERYLAAVAYLDGRHPSVVMCRGYYTRSVLAAFDWDGKRLTSRWVFDTDSARWASYAGQGNHNLRVADVDGDGCDEITYGSCAIDHDGTGLYNTGFGHGAALHLTAFDPSSDRLQVWDCHENKRDGFPRCRDRKGHLPSPGCQRRGALHGGGHRPYELWSGDVVVGFRRHTEYKRRGGLCRATGLADEHGRMVGR